MTTAEQAASPADLFVIPTLRIEVDEQGTPVNAAQPILAEHLAETAFGVTPRPLDLSYLRGR